MVPIDNDVYDRLGRSWWDEGNPLNVLQGSITPGRFAYFREVLTYRFERPGFWAAGSGHRLRRRISC